MKIIVISLKDAAVRRKNITKKFKKIGLEFEFFDAIDCRSGVPSQYATQIDRKKAVSTNGYDLSNAEYGCALSHALVYKKIIDEKIERAIILEDDALLDEDFSTLINGKYLENSNCSGALLYHLFTSTVQIGAKTIFADYKMHSLAKTPLSTAGYYITLDLAIILYYKAMPIYTHADWSTDLASLGVQAIVPRIVQHPALDNSLIQSERTAKQFMFGKYGFIAWLKYKMLKPISKKISKQVEGN